MEEAMRLASGFAVWMIALMVLGVVIFQAVKFILLARDAGRDIGMAKHEINSAIKTGAITAIGPTVAIVIVALSLIPFLGEPLTLMRIGIIGSAPIESVGASLGANAYGTELGSTGFNTQAFTAVVWTLCLGGAGWLLFVALATKSMSKLEKKVINKSDKNKKIMMVVATAAMVAAFGNLASAEMVKGMEYIAAVLVASASMFIFTSLADKLQKNWIREWSLGLSILVSLVVGYFII